MYSYLRLYIVLSVQTMISRGSWVMFILSLSYTGEINCEHNSEVGHLCPAAEGEAPYRDNRSFSQRNSRQNGPGLLNNTF